MAKNKYLAVLSASAVAALLAIPTTAMAADGDIYKTSDKTLFVAGGQDSYLENLDKVTEAVLDGANYKYEYKNKVYDVEVVGNKTANKSGAEFDKSLEAMSKEVVGQDVKEFKGEVKPPVVESSLKVESVSAINASELVVTFNQDVEKFTAENDANYQLRKNNVPANIQNIKVEGKTATILLAANEYFQTGDKYVLQTNDAIKSVDGKKAEKFVSEEKLFNEAVLPVLRKVSLGHNELRLSFTAPVACSSANDVSLIKIDGLAIDSKDIVPQGKVNPNDTLDQACNYNYKVVLTADEAKKVAEKGKHEVVIYDMKDTSSAYQKVASVLNGEYVITEDVVEVPEVTGVESVAANRFFLYTNRSVSLNKAKLTVEKGNHEFVTAKTITDDNLGDLPVGMDNKDTFVDANVGTYKGKTGVWVIVTDDKDGNDENPLYKNGEVSANLKVTLENYTANGLVGKKAVQNVILNKNNTKPAIKEGKLYTDKDSEVAKQNTLEVEFENNLAQIGAGNDALVNLNQSDVVIRDKNGVIKKIKAGQSITVNGKIVKIPLEDVKDAPYTVEFKADKFRNLENANTVSGYLVNTLKNDKMSITIVSKAKEDVNFKYSEFKFDNVAKGNEADVTTAGNYYVSDNQITFCYGVDMSDSARDVSNYTLDGKALPEGSTVDFIGDKKVVRITLPKQTIKDSTKYKFGISTNVTTAAGSYIVGSLQTKAAAEHVIDLKDSIAPKLKSAQFLIADQNVKATTETNEIEVTFNENLNDIVEASAKNDFKVVVNGSTIEVTKVEDGTKKDEKVTITLAQNINVNQGANISIIPDAEHKGVNEISVKDIAGNKASTVKAITVTTSKYDKAYADKVEAAKKVPAVVSTVETSDSKTIVLTMDKNLTDGTYNTANGFTVSGVATNPKVIKVEVAGKKVTLTLDKEIVNTDAEVKVSYDASVGGITKLTGTDGDVANIQNKAVTNNVVAKKVPAVVSTVETSNKNTIVLTMDKNLKNGTYDTANGFTVSGVATNPVVTKVVVAGKTVTLTLNKDIVKGDTQVKVSYDASAGGITKLTGTDGDVENITNKAVTNNI